MMEITQQELDRLQRAADHYANLYEGLYTAGAFALTVRDCDEISRERQRVDRVRIALNRAVSHVDSRVK
jgi:hypothetical protein